jgi:hypothetical protein
MAKSEAISEADVAALAKAIKAAPQPHGFNPAQFCQLWSQVKPVLETILPLARLIPGVGMIISSAITTLLIAGNAASSALCGGH